MRLRTQYLILLILAIFWGSSFILMKEGLKVFSSVQVAAIRMFIAGVCLLPFIKKNDLKQAKGKWHYFLFSGLLGSGIPAILFTIAQQHISSSLAGALNGLTPLFALLVGVVFLNVKFNKFKFAGVIFGLVGAFLLSSNEGISFNTYSILVLFATLCYGINVNIIKHKLGNYPSMLVAALPLAFLAIISLIVLSFTGITFHFANDQFVKSSIAMLLLSVVGTAISLVMFNKLIKSTTAVFAASVTYLIPIVALFWGFLDNEVISINQMSGLGFILIAIYLIRKEN
ncbi:DMT family transporter [Bacteroidia bacterium]|nr:DMT family transporter [Bacteroidia bacterium]